MIRGTEKLGGVKKGGLFMMRRPVVAGQFYPSSRDVLCSTIEAFFSKWGEGEGEAKVVIAPHAGYMFSGETAGKTFAAARIPKRCIVIGPNHTGFGARAALFAAGSWYTPLGEVMIDEGLASSLIKETPLVSDDPTAHLREHSIEVEIPFLQTKRPEVSILPLCLKYLTKEECQVIGEAIARVVNGAGDVLIVVSTDMNHYESEEITNKKDGYAIEKILSLDPEGLLRVCEEKDISMCGVIPTAVALHAARKLGAKEARLIEHTTSGRVNKDFDSVVGYAGFVIK